MQLQSWTKSNTLAHVSVIMFTVALSWNTEGDVQYTSVYDTCCWVVQWLVDASSVAASGCHRWLALLGERVSKMCKSHLAST